MHADAVVCGGDHFEREGGVVGEVTTGPPDTMKLGHHVEDSGWRLLRQGEQRD